VAVSCEYGSAPWGFMNCGDISSVSFQDGPFFEGLFIPVLLLLLVLVLLLLS
jgi:hypothetical protein